jgi:hypothetical protein
MPHALAALQAVQPPLRPTLIARISQLLIAIGANPAREAAAAAAAASVDTAVSQTLSQQPHLRQVYIALCTAAMFGNRLERLRKQAALHISSSCLKAYQLHE